MITWLTTDEVAELYGVTSRTIQRRIASGSLECKVKEVENSKGTKAYMIDLSSLPIEMQKKYYSIYGKQLTIDDIEVDKINSEDTENKKYTLGELQELYGDKYEKNLEEALKKKEAVIKFLSLGKGNKSDNVAEICKEYGFSERSLYRYAKDYEKNGFMALLKKPRKDKGETRLESDAINFIRGCYNQPLRPKASHVYKMYLKKAAEMGWVEVSQATIYREIEKIPEAQKCITREGIKAFDARYSPCITRGYDDLLINEHWVGDGHTLAIWTPESGRIIRYTMSAWMDMKSRAIVGWCIAKHSSSQVIASALRSGIIRHGLPGTCYMDNGKDYRSSFLNAESKEEFVNSYQGVFAALDIKTSFAIPFNAKAKPIERFFRTFSDNLSRYLKGFCGESIPEKPHDLNKKDILVTGIDIEDLSKFIEGYMNSYNNSKHSSLGKSPMEVIEETELFRYDAATEEELDALMLKSEVREIKSSGITKFNTWYWSEKLIPHFGKSCVVRYDPNNLGELYVYVEGKLLCKAVNKELMSMNASEEKMREWAKLKANARKATKEAVKAYGVNQDEVRRLMLQDYVDEETLNNMFTPKSEDVVKKSAKVTRLNSNATRGKEKNRLDKEEQKNFDFFEKMGEQLLQVVK